MCFVGCFNTVVNKPCMCCTAAASLQPCISATLPAVQRGVLLSACVQTCNAAARCRHCNHTATNKHQTQTNPSADGAALQLGLPATWHQGVTQSPYLQHSYDESVASSEQTTIIASRRVKRLFRRQAGRSKHVTTSDEFIKSAPDTCEGWPGGLAGVFS